MLKNSFVGSNPKEVYDLIIIGGGIGGLSTLHYWLNAHKQKRPGLEPRVALLEKSNQLGGKIQTHTVALDDGHYILEAGPDSVLTKKPDALLLMDELGLKDQFIPVSPAAKKLAVYDGQRLVPFPSQCVLGIPTSIDAIQDSNLLSQKAKAVAALEPLIKHTLPSGDISVGNFLKFRLGGQFVEQQVECLLAGIFSADIFKQSLMTTLPELALMLKKHNSLLGGAKAAFEKSKSGEPAFMSLKGGMSGLIDALRSRLSGYIQLDVGAASIEMLPGDLIAVHMNNGKHLATRRLVLAIPAPAAAKLFKVGQPKLASTFASFPYNDTGCVYAVYEKGALNLPEDLYGVLMQKHAPSIMNALTISSLKFEGRAPKNTVLLRAFFGGARRPDVTSLNRNDLLEAVPREICKLFGTNAALRHSEFFLHSENAPQYEVGHLEKVAALEKKLPPGIFLAGSAFRAPGIPACIADAKKLASSIYS
jgi:oxygen-dependent protoporphyrinogen oxidase